MGKPIDGVGLAAVGIGSVLVFAGFKGYSVLAVIQNLVTGKPIATGVSVANPLTTATQPVVGSATGKYVPLPNDDPGMSRDALTQAWTHLQNVGGN